ncbi:MAG: phospholipid carrier-dependent glycosyltransferase [Lachnospiraceae bacterium]|nr:phospholipid carrier-dependent glycosyltransferase [Lachnospiraceae bacterium]
MITFVSSFKKEPRPSVPRMPFTRMDAFLILAFRVVYGMVAFWNLGSTQTPATEYSITSGESLVFDFGEDPGLLEMCWYLRDVDYITFTVASRNSEEEEWSEEEGTTMGKGFYWSSYTLSTSGRYLRLTIQSAGASIAELIFLDEDGEMAVPVNAASTEALFDEAELFPEDMDYRSSTYFDEYLYARTAYAFLNGTEAAEITHPPMGKILMAVGVALFGASPFGFRFMGTLLGVLMLPFIYLLCRDMTGNRTLGAFACFLLSCDFMHFVQTRMATIDVFITFFTLLMFYFMYQYSWMSFYDTPLYRTFLPLGACGVCFSMGVACKWTGFYAGVGLAILFCRVLYLRVREYGYVRGKLEGESCGSARKMPEGEIYESARKIKETEGCEQTQKIHEGEDYGISCDKVIENFWKNMIATLAFAFLFSWSFRL